ncbi:hypothetical protein JKP88DRAFT_193088, partial [Tribonema minus]
MVVTSHKSGMVRLHSSITADFADSTVMLDMTEDVADYNDHGLLSFHFHPQFANGVQKAFLLYTGEPKDVNVLPNNAEITPNRPDGWGAGPPGKMGFTWNDQCRCLDCDGIGPNHYGNICEHPYYLDRVAVDLEAGTMTKEVTLLQVACGSSSSHGPGTVLSIGGDLLVSVGDGSQYAELDPGFDVDGCYVPGAGDDQGVFRAQREDFGNGKVHRIPAALLNAPAAIALEATSPVAIGLRQPFRMFYHAPGDTLWIGDTGFGDGGTTERIYGLNDASAPVLSTAVPNYGWPCIEGVFANTADALAGKYTLWDTPSEQERLRYLEDRGLTRCDGIKLAAQALADGTAPPDDADLMWRPPTYEYRVGALDPNHPDDCGGGLAAITSVFISATNGANNSSSSGLPADYTGKLIFADHVKQCTWFFDADPATGAPDTSVPPHVITANLGLVDIVAGPGGTGAYGIDFANARLVRMASLTAAAAPRDAIAAPIGGGAGGGGAKKPPVAAAKTVKPTKTPKPIPAAKTCRNPRNFPELQWTRNDDGSYEGTLTLDVVMLETERGAVRTRAWNGMIPGPLMRMQPCGTYHLTVKNALKGWPAPPPRIAAAAQLNSVHDPLVTNVHVHGLHVSGEAPGDDVFGVIEPGDAAMYTYTIPCDHASGTNWYHPHHHGSVALQTGGGAAGMLVIEPSAREALGTPAEIAALPEQFVVIQEIDPAAAAAAAVIAAAAAADVPPLLMVNGCADAPAQMRVEAGQWTKLHILNVGVAYNAVATLVAAADGVAACDVVLLGKDGAPVADAPRALPDRKLFLSVSSRVTIAVRCPTQWEHHILTYERIGAPPSAAAPRVAHPLTIVVAPSARDAAPDLPLWSPCRPAYLTDLYTLPPTSLAKLYPLDVRESLNGAVFVGPDEYFTELPIGVAQPWSVSGDDIHPLHVHVNKMQWGADTAGNQWDQVPGWNAPGDWVDTLSAPGISVVYIKPERFLGPMVMHCHIAEHSDMGLLAVAKITGIGSGALDPPGVTDFGTCPADLRDSTPYGLDAVQIPGTIQAEEFDRGGEGIAYHNVNDDRLQGNALRAVTGVEVRASGTTAWVEGVKATEWLRYSVSVAAAGAYTVTLSAGALTPLKRGLSWSLWLDVPAGQGCPPRAQADGRLIAAVGADDFVGSGALTTFAPYTPRAAFVLPLGAHALTLCFDESYDGRLALDALTLARCG